MLKQSVKGWVGPAPEARLQQVKKVQLKPVNHLPSLSSTSIHEGGRAGGISAASAAPELHPLRPSCIRGSLAASTNP